MMKDMLLKLSRRVAVALFWPGLVLVVWGELMRQGGPPLHIWDKALHFIAYFGLAALAYVALGGGKLALRAAVGLALLGGALEIMQGLTGRDMSLYDEIANILGILAGVAVAWGWLSLLGRGRLVGAKPPD